MNKKIIILLKIVVAFISFFSSFILAIVALNATTPINQIIYWLLSYIFAYILLLIAMNRLSKKYAFIHFILHNILAIPMKIILLYNHLTSPLITIYAFLIIYFLPSLLAYKVISNISQFIDYTEGILYILSIISLLIFAYFGQTIMQFIVKVLEPTLLKQSLIKYTNHNYTRLYTYILMSIIYCLYNFLTFSKMSFEFIPNEMMNVIKEVFVSFVAIDTLIQIHLSNKAKIKSVDNP